MFSNRDKNNKGDKPKKQPTNEEYTNYVNSLIAEDDLRKVKGKIESSQVNKDLSNLLDSIEEFDRLIEEANNLTQSSSEYLENLEEYYGDLDL